MIRFMLIAFFFLYIALELFLFGLFKQKFGGVVAFLEVMATTIVGVRILSSQPAGLLRDFQQQMSTGGDPKALLSGGLRILLAGFLLVLPGLVTDLIGLRVWLGVKFGAGARAEGASPWSTSAKPSQDFDQAWQGSDFDEKMKGRPKFEQSVNIEDATIISTEESDGDQPKR